MELKFSLKKYLHKQFYCVTSAYYFTRTEIITQFLVLSALPSSN